MPGRYFLALADEHVLAPYLGKSAAYTRVEIWQFALSSGEEHPKVKPHARNSSSRSFTLCSLSYTF